MISKNHTYFFEKETVYEKRNADWLIELALVVKRYNNTIHKSTKMTPVQASLKKDEKVVFDNLQDKRKKRRSLYDVEDLVKTADIEKVFRKDDSSKWS